MKILICDHDERYINELIEQIKVFISEEDIIFECFHDVSSALYRLHFDEIDMAFVGTCIGEEKGMCLGEEIRKTFPGCFLFFVSDDYDYIHEVFTVHAFQYLIKGDSELLKENIERALELYRERYLQLPFMTVSLEKINFVPSEIIYLETGMTPSKLVTIGGIYYGEFESTVKTKKELAHYHFFQVHQRYFLNLQHIESMLGREVTLDNGDVIPISMYNKAFVYDAIFKYLNKQ